MASGDVEAPMAVDKENAGDTQPILALQSTYSALTAKVRNMGSEIEADMALRPAEPQEQREQVEKLATERSRFVELCEKSLDIQTKARIITDVQAQNPFGCVTGESVRAATATATDTAAAMDEACTRLAQQRVAVEEMSSKVLARRSEIEAKQQELANKYEDLQRRMKAVRRSAGLCEGEAETEDGSMSLPPLCANEESTCNSTLEAQDKRLQELYQRKEELQEQVQAARAQIAELQSSADAVTAKHASMSSDSNSTEDTSAAVAVSSADNGASATELATCEHSSSATGEAAGPLSHAEAAAEKLRSFEHMAKWYSTMQDTLHSISGVRIKKQREDGLDLLLGGADGSAGTYELSLGFSAAGEEDNFCVESARLAPPDFSFDALLDASPTTPVAIEALPQLVRELDARICASKVLTEQLRELRSIYHVDFDDSDAATGAGRVTFALPIGVIATVALRENYPLPGSGGATVTSLDGVNGWDAQALSEVRRELNDCGTWDSLALLAKGLELKLAALDQSQTPQIILKGKPF